MASANLCVYFAVMKANFTKKTMDELGRLHKEEAIKNEHFPIWAILDDVRSMNNVGSVFRTADSFNLSGIILGGYTPQPPHRDIHKTALGATETVTWKHAQDITTALLELKEDGYTVIAIEQTHNSTWLQEYNFTADKKMAFIFGNEVTGVSDAALALCDAVIEIPQFGSKHSLNISVTTGIILWEAAKAFINR